MNTLSNHYRRDCWLGALGAARPARRDHDNRIERTGHQTGNQPNHLAAIFAERGANRVNGKPNACDHPSPSAQSPGNTEKSNPGNALMA